jgi:hypothetical protein
MHIPIKSKRLEAAQAWLYDHPVISAILVLGMFIFIFFPAWGSSVWQLFTDKPFYAWLSERMKTMQFSAYWITVPTGVLAFLFTVYLLVTGRQRTQMPVEAEVSDVETSNATQSAETTELTERIKELEQERTALEDKSQEDARAIEKLKQDLENEQVSHSVALNAARCPDNRIHIIAENDKNNIRNVVVVQGIDSQIEIEDGKLPYIWFKFAIFNMSIYEISIDESIDGYIRFDKEKLTQFKEIVRNAAINCPIRHSGCYFTIQQRLSKDELDLIMNSPDSTPFWFDGLLVKINGGTDYPQVVPRPLEIKGTVSRKSPRWTLVATQEDIEKLEAEIDSLKSTLEEAAKKEATQLQRIHSLQQSIIGHGREIISQKEEIEHYKEQLEPKIDLLFRNEPPYDIVTEIEGTRVRMMRTYPNIRREINIEVIFLTDTIINNLIVDVEEVRLADNSDEKLPLPEIVRLPRMENAPEGRTFFCLAYSATNGVGIKLCSTNPTTETTLPCTANMEIVLVARGSNTAERRKRLHFMVTTAAVGTMGVPPRVSVLPD